MIRRLLALLASVLVLSACEDYGRVTQIVVDAAYSPAELGYATKGGELAVIIQGNPADLETPYFHDIMLNLMNEAHLGHKFRFTRQPQNANPLYRVVMVFNPSSAALGTELCEGRLPPSQPTQAEITVRASFCRGERNMTTLVGAIKPEHARNPQKLRLFIHDITRTLFPRRNS